MGEDIVSDLLGASSDVPGVVEPLVLSVDFTSPAAPVEVESLVLSVDFTSPAAPVEVESLVLSVDFTSPAAPVEVESLVLSVDFTSLELAGEDELSVPCAPPGVVSVVVVPPVVLPEVPAGEFVPVPLEQAPKNASPNTSEKAANVRLTMISPKICKIFCMESGLLTPALE